METISCDNLKDVKIAIPKKVSKKENQKTTIVNVSGVEFGG